MFWGEFTHQLDAKGRLIIPARYRTHLGPGAILTRGLDHNLVIYPQNAWRAVTEHLNQMPITQASGRALRRLMFSGALELELDRQGRVLIPTYLRAYAQLENAALVVGMETYLEIWQPDNWRIALNDVSSVLAAADVQALGF
ncbi:MAG: division/cell wall cluster transcriptional repressor MraZ [Chloroflexi bacterium]|nr:division/cell wall cluster transcriptional repressor MraZ [Chloroflexota bacterium]